MDNQNRFKRTLFKADIPDKNGISMSERALIDMAKRSPHLTYNKELKELVLDIAIRK